MKVTAILALLCALQGLASGQLQRGPTRSPCPHALKINTNYQFRARLHFICLQAQSRGPTKLEVIDYTANRPIITKDIGYHEVSQMASFVDNDGNLRILLAVPGTQNGTSMYSVDPTSSFVDEVHTVNAQLVSAMSIWRMDLNWEWQLAIANQPKYDISYDSRLRATRTPSQIPIPRPMITLYSWRSTYFDQYQLIQLPQDGKVNKIEPMNINGQEFLIIVMEPHHDSNDRSHGRPVDSLIFKLDFGTANLDWQLYQNLRTNLALDVKSFEITHKDSMHRDYYIALLADSHEPIFGDPTSQLRSNFTDSQPGEVEGKYGLVIYKYFGDRFVKTNSLVIPGAVKLDAITYGSGDSYVLIALLMAGTSQIQLFIFDGLNLRQVPVQIGAPVPRSLSPMMKYPYQKQRRTLDSSSNLHLFNIMPDMNDSNGTAYKRTLVDEETVQNLAIPTLVLSTSLDLGDEYLPEQINKNNSSDSTSKLDTLYQIPIQDIIRQESDNSLKNETDSGYAKREFVGPPKTESLLTSLFEWCKATINELSSDNFDLLSTQLQALPRINQNRPIELKGDLIIEDDLYVSNLLMARDIHERLDSLGPQVAPVRSLGIQTADHAETFERIRQAHADIDILADQVSQILVDDGTDQYIYWPIQFETVLIECSPLTDPRFTQMPYSLGDCPRVDDIRTARLNNRDISNIQSQALITGRSMEIRRDVRFEHLVLRGNVSILGTLNGLNVNEIVFKRGRTPAPIVGQKTFRGGLYSASNLLVGDWDGQRVDRVQYLTTTGDQRIDSALRVSQVVLAQRTNGSRIERINGINMDSYINSIVRSDDINFFNSPIHFEELVINGPISFAPNSHLNSINLHDQWHKTMYKQQVQNISAPVKFATQVHVSYGGDITVDGLINGMLLNADSILMRNRRAVIFNPVVFDNDVDINNVRLKKSLNAVQVLPNGPSGRPELAILYNQGDQIITGRKIFSEISLAGQSSITGSINGNLNISHLYSLANTNGQPYNFARVHLTGDDIRVAPGAPMHIQASVNGISAQELCSLAINLNQAKVIQHQRLRFHEPVAFKSLRCASINGFNNLQRSFLTRSGDQFVMGSLRLMNGAIFNSTIRINSTLNNLPVAPLASAIAKIVNDNRLGHRDIYGDLRVDELIANKINDLSLHNIFLARADTPQYVRAPMTFDHLDMENLVHVGRSLVTNSFNGLNISDILANTLTYDTPQVIYNHIELGTLQILPNSSFLTKSLNGQELGRLYSDAVLKDIPQQVLAPKTFAAPVEFLDRLYAKHGIDDLNEQELRLHMLLQGDEVLEDDLVFDQELIVRKELDIQSGLINDIDVNIFADSLVHEKKPKGMIILGNGSVTFQDVHLNDLVVAGKIQGIDLSRDAIQRQDNINGTYDAFLRDRQAVINNQRLINSVYGPGSSFGVQSQYRDVNHQGQCYVHSCSSRMTYSPPPRGSMEIFSSPPHFYNQPLVPPNRVYQNVSVARPVLPAPAPLPQPQALVHPAPPIKYIQQFYPNILPTRIMPILDSNRTSRPQVWRPKWDTAIYSKQEPLVNRPLLSVPAPETFISTRPNYDRIDQAPGLSGVEVGFVEHKNRLLLQAIDDISVSINKYLSISFYYDTVQQHQAVGTPLHAGLHPASAENLAPMLLLKAVSKPGEPCLLRNQSVALMSKKFSGIEFSQTSLIKTTSNPTIIDSVFVKATRRHYLFIVDSAPGVSLSGMVDQVMVFVWNYDSSMYDHHESIVVDGAPIALRPVVLDDGIVCFALASPQLVVHSNLSGPPLLRCQSKPNSKFNQLHVLPLSNVFDIDVVTLPGSSELIITSLSQQSAEHVGDLHVIAYDVTTRASHEISIRRLVRPLKLHIFQNSLHPRSPQDKPYLRLAVAEAITTSDSAQAKFRIYTLRLRNTLGLPGNQMLPTTADSQFYESQVLEDNQFHDIQSVSLDDDHRLLFLQSAHSISIYAPTSINYVDSEAIGSERVSRPNCDDGFSLIQRLPLRGANKFLVFNKLIRRWDNSTSVKERKPYGHYMMLSRDECEHRKSSTMILKAFFH